MCFSGSSSLTIENILPAVIHNNIKELPDIGADGMSSIMISHHILAKFVFLLLIFHIVGFLIHLIRKRENTLKRIWFKE
jgi:cytochrome b561